MLKSTANLGRTKDTSDKNKDKASWPLSCCIPDLPLDKSDPTEIFRGPQGCVPGYVQKFSWSPGPRDTRYGNQLNCILLGFSWSTGSHNQSFSKLRHIFQVCSTTLIFCSDTKFQHISLQNKSQRWPLWCHTCYPFSCVTPKSLSRKKARQASGTPKFFRERFCENPTVKETFKPPNLEFLLAKLHQNFCTCYGGGPWAPLKISVR